MEKNEDLKVTVVNLYRPSSAYYTSRSSFCYNEKADAHSLAHQLFLSFSNVAFIWAVECQQNVNLTQPDQSDLPRILL